MTFNARVLGVRKLQKRLQHLKTSQARRIMASSLLAGARVVRTNARRAIPTRFRHVRPDVHIKSLRGRGQFPVTVKIGTTLKMTKARQEAAHARVGPRLRGSGVGIVGRNWHWPVLGTKKRYTRAGHYRGRMPVMHPDFMNRVWTASVGGFRAAMLARGRLMIRNLNR